MWNEFKELLLSWFEKVKSLFIEEVEEMEPIRTQFEHLEKNVFLGNGYPATIRIGLPEDATRIFEVEKAAYDGDSPWAKDVLEKDVAHNPAAIYIVLEVEGNIVGFVGARTTQGTDLHITNVAVLPDYRFLNIATLLLKALEKIARALDKKEITLEARESNTKAIRLYHKNGYEVVGTKENYYTPENEDAVEMLFKLPPKTPSSFHSSEYSFTRLHPADLAMAEALVALVQENYEHPNNWSAESFLADLENPTNTYYGVWMQRQLVGFLGIQTVLDEATITNIVIAKDYQGKGLAQRLWQMALYDLKQKEVKVIFLEVRKSNTRAQYLYEILGFEAFHTRSDYYKDPIEDAIEYRLEIGQE